MRQTCSSIQEDITIVYFVSFFLKKKKKKENRIKDFEGFLIRRKLQGKNSCLVNYIVLFSFLPFSRVLICAHLLSPFYLSSFISFNRSPDGYSGSLTPFSLSYENVFRCLSFSSSASSSRIPRNFMMKLSRCLFCLTCPHPVIPDAKSTAVDVKM